jgi:hypothetical protein
MEVALALIIFAALILSWFVLPGASTTSVMAEPELRTVTEGMQVASVASVQ